MRTFTLALNTEKNTDYIKNMLQTKTVQNLISYKKVSGHTSLLPLRVELEG